MFQLEKVAVTVCGSLAALFVLLAHWSRHSSSIRPLNGNELGRRRTVTQECAQVLSSIKKREPGGREEDLNELLVREGGRAWRGR